MDDVLIKSIHDIAAYEGPHAIDGLRFRPARQALGVSSWGMNVLEFDPGCEGYPEHDHASEGHEEVYVVLRGSVVLQTTHGEQTLTEGQFVRVAPELKRKFITKDQGATLLALGGTPGQAYEPSMGG